LNQHSQTADYVNKWKFTGHELDRETGLYYAKARYYDPKMSVFLSVDPMLEKYPGWSPYNYTLNNPINLVDPTGMEADDPPLGMSREHGTFYSDNTGSWKYDKHSDTWKGQNGSPDIDNAQNIQTVEVTGNKSSKKGYFESYFKDYFSYKRPAHAKYYSPYIPSGTGLTVSGSIGSFSVSLSFAVNEKNDMDLFFSLDGKLRLHNIFKKPFGVSATFDIYNNNGKTGNILDNMTGKYRTISGGMIFSGAYSYPIKNGIIDKQGVTKTSFGLGTPSAGYEIGKTWMLFGNKK